MSGPYGEAPPKRGTFSRLHVYKRVEMSIAEIYERVGRSVISICKKTQKGQQMNLTAVKESRKRYGLVIYSHLKDSAFTAAERKAKFVGM